MPDFLSSMMFNAEHNLPRLRLNKGKDKRQRAGRMWIYRNEIDKPHEPFKTVLVGGGA